MTAPVHVHYEVRGVLAGAYRGRRLERVTPLQHYYDADGYPGGADRTLCGRIHADNLCDVAESTPATCRECCERFERRAAKGLATTDASKKAR